MEQQAGAKGDVVFGAGVFLACVLAVALTLRLGGETASGQPTASVATPTTTAIEQTEPLSEVEWRALAQQATVRISIRSCTTLTLGSGFVVEDRLLTNEHLVGPAAELKVETPTGPAFVPINAVSEPIDLAVADAPPAVGLNFASAPAALGDRVMLAGFADGRATPEVQLGSVKNRVSGELYGLSGDVLLIEAETRGGYSGGPVLDRYGDVVAMLSGFDRSTGLTVAVPSSEIMRFIADLSPGDQVSGPNAVVDCSRG